MSARLVLTDGTVSINLLNPNANGITVNHWRQSITPWKGGGVWQQSSLSDYERLVLARYSNAVEQMPLCISGLSPNDLAYVWQEFIRLALKGIHYWTTDWQDEPVWIEKRADGETNVEYAQIVFVEIPQLGDIFAPGQYPEPAMGNLMMSVSRLHWQADQPGTGTCVAVSGLQAVNYPYYVIFNGTTSEIDCSSDAGLDDLHDAAFTAEAWIKFSEWGEGNAGRIFDKTGSAAQGWTLYVNTGNGLVGTVFAGAVPPTDSGISRSGTDDLTTDDEWHHVAMTWDDATYNYPRLWIDGTEASYSSTQNRNGAVISDAANDFYIGNRSDGTLTFDGNIGWCRISDSIRYTAPFTPPSRCIFPDSDGNTVALWIREGAGTSIDNAEGTAARDGTAANITWSGDCDRDFGRTATCEDEVYIANKQNIAQLTHVFVDDGGVFGGNLIGAATPFNLLPAVPAVNDAAYFGIDTTTLDSGPFASLVFDIGTAQTGVTGTWEYWNGAWVALTVQDNTATTQEFDTTGVNSVHWVQPSDWATTAVNGITGYWVRMRVTGAAAATAPTQQNRDVYTITWAYVDIASDEVPGDIAALAGGIYFNQSSGVGSTGLYTNRLIVGLRSYNRGPNFDAFINASDEQNQGGITVVVGDVTTSFATDVTAPSGRSMLWNPGGAVTEDIATFRFSSALSSEYYGSYHAFARALQLGGSGGDTSISLGLVQYASGGLGADYNSPYISLTQTSIVELIDLGRLDILPTQLNADQSLEELRISISGTNTNASPPDLYLYDIILIPVDEWAADVFPPASSGSWDSPTSSNKTQNIRLCYDSLYRPKVFVRSFLDNETTEAVRITFSVITNGPVILQSAARQRIWYLAQRRISDPAVAIGSPFEIGATIRITGSARYLSMRGAR